MWNISSVDSDDFIGHAGQQLQQQTVEPGCTP
jgi:hypothetical protein